MEIWIIFALLAQFIWGFTAIIDKMVISKEHIKNPLVFILLNAATNLFFVFLLPFVSFESIGLFNFSIALLSGIGITAGIAVYYEAVKHEEISKIFIIFQIIPIFTLIFSYIFLGEILTSHHYAGFMILLLAGLIVSYKKSKNRFRFSKAFYLILISSILIAVAYVAAKHVLVSTSFWNGVLWLRITQLAGLSLLFVPSIRNDFISTYKGMHKGIKDLLGFKMVIDFSAFILSDIALFLGPVTLVSALGASSGPLFVFAIALFFTLYFPKIIKEDTSTRSIIRKIAAIALVIVGISFVSF